MTVVMTSEALGKLPGENFTGTAGEEAWLLAEGYAKKANYADKTPATLAGASNAVNIATGGNLVLATAHEQFTIVLAASDTPAAAATKIDTALANVADASIVSSKLNVVTTGKTGEDSYIRVVSGTGTVLANLGLTAGQRAQGGEGGIGVADSGLTATPPNADLTAAANREPGPSYNELGVPDPGRKDPAMFPGEDPEPIKPAYDYDAGGVNDDAPSDFTVEPNTGLSVNLVDVEIHGQNLTGTTGVTFGGTAATNVVVVSDELVTAKAPAHAAGLVDVVVTNSIGSKTETGAYTYVAPAALALAPATGLAAGGTPVVITGEGFTGATGVTFGGTAGTAFSVVSDTEIHVTTPPKTAGAYNVVVVDAAGNQTKVNGYTFT